MDKQEFENVLEVFSNTIPQMGLVIQYDVENGQDVGIVYSWFQNRYIKQTFVYSIENTYGLSRELYTLADKLFK